MKEIWTKSKAEFHGKHVDFDPIMTWPKPVQQPHPPIHVGGGFPKGARRAVEYGDGWMPIFGRDEIVARLPELRAHARRRGSRPGRVRSLDLRHGPASRRSSRRRAMPASRASCSACRPSRRRKCYPSSTATPSSRAASAEGNRDLRALRSDLRTEGQPAPAPREPVQAQAPARSPGHAGVRAPDLRALVRVRAAGRRAGSAAADASST